MHLYLFARGKFEQLKLWEAHAQSYYWKLRRQNLKTGKEEIILVQGALRPSIFGAYEYVFPKEALAEVCSCFGIVDNIQYGFGKFGLKLRHFLLREAFGAKPIPKKILEKSRKIHPTFSTEEFERAMGNCRIPGVSIHLIGIKEDKFGTLDGAYHHELL